MSKERNMLCQLHSTNFSKKKKKINKERKYNELYPKIIIKKEKEKKGETRLRPDPNNA